jgi:hypothetical protein
MSHDRNRSAPIPPPSSQSHPGPTQPPVDLGDAQTGKSGFDTMADMPVT